MSGKKEEKHDRSHGAAYLAGQTKKGGAGGKYTWGVPGTGDLQQAAIDPSDPAYDSEEEDAKAEMRTALHKMHGDVQAAFKAKCLAILDEYYRSEELGEVVRLLQEVNEPGWMYEFVKQSVVTALEKHDRERELTSSLLSGLSDTAIGPSSYQLGFNRVLERVPDLVLDTPNASELVGNFLARAVVDEILPPAFLSQLPEALTATPQQKEAVSKAKSLLEGHHVGERVSNIWSNNVSSSAKKLKRAMRTILEEYLADGGDQREAERCLRELNVPGVHFQFVKIAVALGLEKKAEDRSRLSTLLAALVKEQLISEAHVASGFRCCLDQLSDLEKDISPNVRQLLTEWLELAKGYLPADVRTRALAELAKPKTAAAPAPAPAAKPAAADANPPKSAEHGHHDSHGKHHDHAKK